MKRYLLIAGCILLTAALVQAQEVRIGAHIGSAMNGTLEQDTGFGTAEADLEDGFAFGAQLTHRANEAMSLEVSITRFSTEVENISNTDTDVLTVAATIRLGGSPSQGVYIYGGGGGSYNTFDMDGEDFDDEFGYHFCGGLELPVNETAQFFADYRVTFITFDTDITDIEIDYQFGLLRAGMNFSL